MNTPIIVDPEDPKWLLLKQIIEITRARTVKQAMARQGLQPVEKTGTINRILFLSMFFSNDIAYVVRELEKRSQLRSFMHIIEVPSTSMIYQFISKFDEAQFIHFISDVLNNMCKEW